MPSDPFLPVEPPTTLLAALTAGLGIAGLVIRALWTTLRERDQRIADVQDARVEDQKAHTLEIIAATETMTEMKEPIQAAIRALSEQKRRIDG